MLDIADKEKQLAILQEQERTLVQFFVESIGENNKFKDFLMKVRGCLCNSMDMGQVWMALLIPGQPTPRRAHP
jgi:hypothetical protein